MPYDLAFFLEKWIWVFSLNHIFGIICAFFSLQFLFALATPFNQAQNLLPQTEPTIKWFNALRRITHFRFPCHRLIFACILYIGHMWFGWKQKLHTQNCIMKIQRRQCGSHRNDLWTDRETKTTTKKWMQIVQNVDTNTKKTHTQNAFERSNHFIEIKKRTKSM